MMPPKTDAELVKRLFDNVPLGYIVMSGVPAYITITMPRCEYLRLLELAKRGLEGENSE